MICIKCFTCDVLFQRVSDMCGDTHWKAAKAASKTLQHVSETGVMIGVCRHGIQLKALNTF